MQECKSFTPKSPVSIIPASFDDPNLVSAVGLLPIMRLADDAGLRALAQDQLSIASNKGANAGAKITSLIGGMNKLFNRRYAPSTLGSFLRSFTFGYVRQLDAVASRFLVNLAGQAQWLLTPNVKKAIAAIPEDAWQTIRYTNAIFDEASQSWISSAEVSFTGFGSRKKTDHIPPVGWWSAGSQN